jgi:four helix bundle protein
MPFKFEKLEVWKESVELTGLVHEVCKTFPKDEIYILTSQIKRAADLVMRIQALRKSITKN